MADKTVTVRPSGGDYTSLSAAILGEKDINADLTAGGMDGILYIKIEGDWSGAPDTTLVSINYFTTDATHYVSIYTDSANRAKASGWDTSRYILAVTDAIALSIADDYVRVDGLQIDQIYSSTAAQSGIYISSIVADNNYQRISNCRIRGTVNGDANGVGIRVNDVDSICDIWNCIVYNHDGGGIFVDNGGVVNIWNCTVAYINDDAIELDTGTITIKNCAVFDNVDDFQDDTGAATIDYCASDDGDGANGVAESGGGSGWPNDFEGAATGDFRLKSGSNLVGAGVDNPSAGLFTNDIDGTTRDDWDVGAYEYPPVGGSTIVPKIMMYYRRLRG